MSDAPLHLAPGDVVLVLPLKRFGIVRRNKDGSFDPNGPYYHVEFVGVSTGDGFALCAWPALVHLPALRDRPLCSLVQRGSRA